MRTVYHFITVARIAPRNRETHSITLLIDSFIGDQNTSIEYETTLYVATTQIEIYFAFLTPSVFYFTGEKLGNLV